MKKLVIVTTSSETLATILKGQPKMLSQSFDITLVSSSLEQFERQILLEGVRHEVITMSRGISLISDVKSIWLMFSLLRSLQPDIIHSYTPKAGLVAMLAACFCRTPIRIHTFTGLIFPTSIGFKKKLLMLIDRLICFCATTVVPEGEGVKADLQAYDITRKPLKVIGYGNIAGVSTADFERSAVRKLISYKLLKAKLSLAEDEFVFVFVGRLNKDKGVSELVNAFSQLTNKAHLIVVGSIDVTAPIDVDTQHALVQHPRIHVLGHLTDIRPALALADVLVLPSYREGFPNAPLQAGAMELPCIVSDINGCNEIIKPNFNGWIVPVKNSNALAKAMRKSMQVENLAQLGLQARNNIAEKFEREVHWQNMLNFYKQQLANVAKY